MADNEIQSLLRELADEQRRLALLVKKKSQAERPVKDNWDRIGAVAPIISGFLIFGVGLICTNSFNQAQLHLQEIQTIEKFIPHMMGSEKSKQAAIMAMSSLTNTKLAARFASLFASEGTVSALQTIAASGDKQDKTIANHALASTLSNLAERYKEEERYEEAELAYKKAADALKKLSELYRLEGNSEEAQALLKQAVAIDQTTSINEERDLSSAAKLAKLELEKEAPAEAKTEEIKSNLPSPIEPATEIKSAPSAGKAVSNSRFSKDKHDISISAGEGSLSY